jgi:hypothetical protein
MTHDHDRNIVCAHAHTTHLNFLRASLDVDVQRTVQLGVERRVALQTHILFLETFDVGRPCAHLVRPVVAAVVCGVAIGDLVACGRRVVACDQRTQFGERVL